MHYANAKKQVSTRGCRAR